MLYKHRIVPKRCLKTPSGAQQGVQVLLRFWFKPCLGLHERNHLMKYFRRIWKHLKDKSSVSRRLTFIDFLHHLVGIKINCSHFMKTKLFRMPMASSPRHREQHWGSQFWSSFAQWDRASLGSSVPSTTVNNCLILGHIRINPSELRPRGPCGRADLKEHYWCATELWS